MGEGASSRRDRVRPIGIIDIGSNSIRLVVYDLNSRTPVPRFNEKAVCALGQNLGLTGRLNPDGVTLALATLGRFARLAEAMCLERVEVLATAAVRDAVDGPDFVAAIERIPGLRVRVLTGGHEARLAALGVLCGTPDAEGMVADLGGGSLELIQVRGGEVGRHATMPLGVLRLAEAGNRLDTEKLIDSHLDGLPWIGAARGGTLYVVGGAWRSIARLCIAQTGHPLMVLDNFTLDRAEAVRLIDLLSQQSRKSLEKVRGISKKRLPHLPNAALLLEKVLRAAMPARLVFSVYGMREGQFFKMLPDSLREQDALIAACRQLARQSGRFPEHGDEILEWMALLFPDESAAERRLRHAACLLSDCFWAEHPDYRAEQAMFRVLRLPFMGMGHRDRAFLAVAIHNRHAGEDGAAQAITGLLSEEELRHARLVGLATRLAHTISGGVPGLIGLTRIRIEGRALVLDVPAADAAFLPELTDRRADRLARALGCESLDMRRV